jgi:organic radical activating enzyme
MAKAESGMLLTYLIDIVGTCNLRCPSCPVGNMAVTDFVADPRKKGFMELDLFTKVVDKIEAECAAQNRPFEINLYNWGEPMIHPQFDEICRILAKRNIRFHISSNLNNEVSFAQALRTAATLRASTSGFTNETYQQSHVGGDINLFISNLYRLRHTIDKVKSTTEIQVFYHVYKDNCDENMAKLRNLCAELGFRFDITYALFMGVEKYLYYIEGSPHFGEKDRKTAERMLFSLDDAMQIAKYGIQDDCILRQYQTVINHDGSVPTCCAVFDPANYVASNFLDVPHEELHARKMSAAVCEKCMTHNIHNLAIYLPGEMFEEVAAMRLQENRQKYIARLFSEPCISEAVYPEDRDAAE